MGKFRRITYWIEPSVDLMLAPPIVKFVPLSEPIKRIKWLWNGKPVDYEGGRTRRRRERERVERVAKAICSVLCAYEGDVCDCPSGVTCRSSRETAEAAIKAMEKSDV